MHTTADDPSKYRTEEEVEKWIKRDPLSRFQQYLKNKGLLTDGVIAALETEIENELKEVARRTEEQMKNLGDPVEMFNHHFDELPSSLLEQREEMIREWSLDREEATHG
jgi:TPP-dependent pyruvate/acetoin dehydrogenase alpha subunit